MRIPYEILILGLMLLPQVYALEFGGDIPDSEQQQFAEILTPVMRVYNFIRFASAAVAALALVVAGIMFMTSGNNPLLRQKAKLTAGFVISGLALVWMTPFLVNFFV